MLNTLNLIIYKYTIITNSKNIFPKLRIKTKIIRKCDRKLILRIQNHIFNEIIISKNTKIVFYSYVNWHEVQNDFFCGYQLLKYTFFDLINYLPKEVVYLILNFNL
jgi:hypothetical protein